MPNSVSIVGRVLSWFGLQAPARRMLGRRPVTANVRTYASARSGRTTAGFGSAVGNSADAELASSLSRLRARARQLVRDSAYAKRARTIVVNNVIGQGIGLQAQVATTRKELHSQVNAGIEASWERWCAADQCHVGGSLHFSDMERMAMGQVFEAGEIFLRKHRYRFGASRIPLALEVIEAERLPDEFTSANVLGPAAPGNSIRLGVEVDPFFRPVAYYIRTQHPGDLRFSGAMEANLYERVPADEIIHLRMIDRWPQTRGEPWLHTVLRKLDDMNEYSGAEVEAARLNAYIFATVESEPNPDGPNPLANEGAGTGNGDQTLPPSYDIEPGTVQHLDPGEKLNFHAPNRPNTAIDPFLRYMLREVAAGAGVSYESLSRDYGQTTYSSGRLALLDDRDLYKFFQQWWIRAFRMPFHREWLQMAVLANDVAGLSIEQYMPARDRYEKVLFKPRGWSWVDPTKEVEAYKEAVKAGFTTITDVIAATGGGQDIEDVLATRKRELEMLEEAEINVDTTVPETPDAAGEPGDLEDPPGGPDDGEPADGEGTNDDPQSRVVSIRR